jgi:CheY-like chemotaxis protein
MNQTVLIADSDPEWCSVCWRFLTERGFLAQTATDGHDCVEKLRRLTPGVLALDPALRSGRGAGVIGWVRDVCPQGLFGGLARSGGTEVLAWLREEGPLDAVPVILTPETGFRRNVAEFLAPPVVQCLPKPFDLMAFLENVRSALTLAHLTLRDEDAILAVPEAFAG